MAILQRTEQTINSQLPDYALAKVVHQGLGVPLDLFLRGTLRFGRRLGGENAIIVADNTTVLREPIIGVSDRLRVDALPGGIQLGSLVWVARQHYAKVFDWVEDERIIVLDRQLRAQATGTEVILIGIPILITGFELDSSGDRVIRGLRLNTARQPSSSAGYHVSITEGLAFLAGESITQSVIPDRDLLANGFDLTGAPVTPLLPGAVDVSQASTVVLLLDATGNAAVVAVFGVSATSGTEQPPTSGELRFALETAFPGVQAFVPLATVTVTAPVAGAPYPLEIVPAIVQGAKIQRLRIDSVFEPLIGDRIAIDNTTSAQAEQGIQPSLVELEISEARESTVNPETGNKTWWVTFLAPPGPQFTNDLLLGRSRDVYLRAYPAYKSAVEILPDPNSRTQVVGPFLLDYPSATTFDDVSVNEVFSICPFTSHQTPIKQWPDGEARFFRTEKNAPVLRRPISNDQLLVWRAITGKLLYHQSGVFDIPGTVIVADEHDEAHLFADLVPPWTAENQDFDSGIIEGTAQRAGVLYLELQDSHQGTSPAAYINAELEIIGGTGAGLNRTVAGYDVGANLVMWNGAADPPLDSTSHYRITYQTKSDVEWLPSFQSEQPCTIGVQLEPNPIQHVEITVPTGASLSPVSGAVINLALNTQPAERIHLTVRWHRRRVSPQFAITTLRRPNWIEVIAQSYVPNVNRHQVELSDSRETGLYDILRVEDRGPAPGAGGGTKYRLYLDTVFTTGSAFTLANYAVVERFETAPRLVVGDWSLNGARVGSFRYTLVAHVVGRYTWGAGGVIVKPVWSNLRDLAMRLDDRDQLDGGRLLV